MKSVETVLTHRTRELVEVLVQDAGLSEERATRFVALAGSDLMDSCRWQARELAMRSLASPSAARDVLSAMLANRIASQLGMDPSEVWASLRELVPRVLRLADDPAAA